MQKKAVGWKMGHLRLYPSHSLWAHSAKWKRKCQRSSQRRPELCGLVTAKRSSLRADDSKELSSFQALPDAELPKALSHCKCRCSAKLAEGWEARSAVSVDRQTDPSRHTPP